MRAAGAKHHALQRVATLAACIFVQSFGSATLGTMDMVSLLLAVAGGFFFGCYPVPIKCRSVCEAGVHPLIFQLWKSTWVFVSGLFFLIPGAIHRGAVVDTANEAGVYEFSFWGLISAGCWIPSGTLTIASVPILGVGLQVALSASSASTISFLAFWLIFGTEMKEHTTEGGET